MDIKTESRVCKFCGNVFEDHFTTSKHKYCSAICANRQHQIDQGRVKPHQEEERECIVCGKAFTTYILHKKTCSPECSNKRDHVRRTPVVYTEDRKQRRKEYDRQKYLRTHPDALTREEIHARKLARDAEKEQKQIERESQRQELVKIRAHKEAVKQANRAMYLEYEQEHVCCVCGEKYIAHHPFSKYCSKACGRKNTRPRDNRHRYKDITIDKGITLPKLAKRDHDQCQICGLFVDWNDYIQTDKTIICGDMYPSIDHIRPISLGGVHSWENVQLAHRGCNTRKNNKYVG